MEISSLLNSLLGRQPQSRPETPVDIANIEQARPGTRLTGTVESIRDISATQKQALLTQLNEELARLKTGSSTPELRTPSGPPSSQTPGAGAGFASRPPNSIGAAQMALATLAKLELLTSPKLLLAEVKLLSNTHLVYTNRPFSIGQQIQVQVRNDGQLLLVDGAAKGMQEQAGSLNSTTATQTAINSPPAGNTMNREAANREAAEMIAHGLRRYLPQTEPVKELFTTIVKLMDITKAIPDSIKPTLLPEPAWKALKQLNQQALSPEQLQKPEVIQYVLKNSGQFFESRLAKLVRNDPSSVNKSFAMPAADLMKFETPRERLATADNKISSESTAIRQIVDNDQKALLLSLVKTLTSVPAATADSVAGVTTRHPGPDLFSLLTILFNQLGRGLKVKQDQAQNQQQLVALLKSQVNASIARIQTQQLQQVHQVGGDSVATSTGGMFEIPVKINENLFPLFIHIQEKPIKEKTEREENKDKKNGSRKKSRRWHVFMEFDLDEVGWFASEINVCDNKVKTLLWAENTHTRNSARQKLEELQAQLKQSGIEVEELRCLEGKPPKRPTGIKQTLVDITT